MAGCVEWWRRRLQELWIRVPLESPMALWFHEEGRGQNELGILDPFTIPDPGGSVNREGSVRSAPGRSAKPYTAQAYTRHSIRVQ
ncbi:hypothetical protein V6N12_029899 [Hibiscus sabdariffa]|uniref:Uncharacterized protein n=1 Tax=Hibiscus sabdariffa TaxID=183260 RepID=A0ABR2CXG5_9ROSI